METLPPISKEFLQQILNRKVESFELKPGASVGDNYMSVIYSIKVNVYKQRQNENEIETLHLISKCYPTNPTRRKFHIKLNNFWNELSAYKILLPALNSILKGIGDDENMFFPPFIAGNAVDFQNMRENGDTTHQDKNFEPFDMYIMMTDIQKTFGYRMADRRKELDFYEMKLMISALAKLHVLSWGYKKLNNLESLSHKFDFLQVRFNAENFEMWIQVLENSVLQAADTVEKFQGKELTLGGQIRKVIGHVRDLLGIAYAKMYPDQKMDEAHRLPPPTSNPQEPWRVLLHGDCWMNNLLFKYDETTSVAKAVVLIDFQIMSEHCPTLDLAYLIYSSTTSDFRKTQLSEILKMYHQEFTSYCDRIGVSTLPNFTLEELFRRFHRSKILGFLYAATLLPLVLSSSDEINDIDTIIGEQVDIFINLKTQHESSTRDLLGQRIQETALELHQQGVL